MSGKGIFGLTLMKNFSNRELPSIGKVQNTKKSNVVKNKPNSLDGSAVKTKEVHL